MVGAEPATRSGVPMLTQAEAAPGCTAPLVRSRFDAGSARRVRGIRIVDGTTIDGAEFGKPVEAATSWGRLTASKLTPSAPLSVTADTSCAAPHTACPFLGLDSPPSRRRAWGEREWRSDKEGVAVTPTSPHTLTLKEGERVTSTDSAAEVKPEREKGREENVGANVLLTVVVRVGEEPSFGSPLKLTLPPNFTFGTVPVTPKPIAREGMAAFPIAAIFKLAEGWMVTGRLPAVSSMDWKEGGVKLGMEMVVHWLEGPLKGQEEGKAMGVEMPPDRTAN